MIETTHQANASQSYTFASRTSQRTDQSLQKSMSAPTHNTTTDRRAACNSGFAKKRVQWLIEHSTSHQILWCIDSLVLRNPLLRKAANRYHQC